MDTREKLLIVEDNKLNRDMLLDMMSDEYEVIGVNDGVEAFEVLEKDADSILAILLDIVMPNMDGYTFLKKIVEIPRFSRIPILVNTDFGDRENEIKALELGAWDFISKPYNAKIIKARLRNAVERSYIDALEKFKYLTEYDSLTKIYGKEKFFEKTKQMILQNRSTSFAFFRFDIDRFQLINSFFGKEEGDKLLRYIAEQLKLLMKLFQLCTYGRIEADIFCVCIPNSDKERIINTLKKTRVVLENFNPNYDIVPSIGIYIIKDAEMSMEAIYDLANLAARQCKGNYVDYYIYYNEKLSQELIRCQEITNEMKAALEAEQFQIYLQPKYNLKKQKIDGAEALVRWIHPVKGLLSPGEFIPIFEQNGFISRLDYFVWGRACMLLKKWKEEGKTPLPISVNISRVNIYNPKFVDIVIGLVKQYQIEPKYLNLELTESAYTDNPSAMIEAMNRLKEYGFTIMMDDFGSGYSSLNILKDIPVDILKIDMKFFSSTTNEGKAEGIVTGVIQMAKWLNLPVVAEGIETKEQVDWLTGIGCDYIQGFYYAAPMPVSEFEKGVIFE